ncbi:MAG: hypothetical protein N2167_05095 [Flavobacteriales bacterium]|nr:hypothetical protein [Flavobacteriales bacterium]
MKISFSLVIILIASIVTAQRRVALHHQGTVQIFSSPNAFQEAYNAASNGDTIYLPGGQYNSLSISKKLYIYGAGYHIDSTSATNYTILTNDFYFYDGADGTVIEGVYLNGSFRVYYNNKVDSLRIRRNYISGVIHFDGDFNALETLKSTGAEISENIVHTISANYATNIHIHHNIFRRLVYIKENGWIHHNIWIESIYHSTADVFNSLFENNYIAHGWWGLSVANNTFIKNAFELDPTSDLNNIWIGNYLNVSATSLFVNPSTPYNFSQFPLANFHLNNPASYLGTDGTEIGLFGGNKPFKQGGLPNNPHIRYKNIAPQTDSNGNLSIDIKVGAQNY